MTPTTVKQPCRQAIRPGRLRRSRRGSIALEEVMISAVMIPLVFGAYLIAQKMCVAIYEIISTLVGWPFL